MARKSVVPLVCQFYFTSNYSSKGQAFFRAKWAPWAVELLNGKFGVLTFNRVCYWQLLSISSRLKCPTWQLVNQLLESLQPFDRVLDLGHLDEDGVHLQGEQRVWRLKQSYVKQLNNVLLSFLFPPGCVYPIKDRHPGFATTSMGAGVTLSTFLKAVVRYKNMPTARDPLSNYCQSRPNVE